jgi:hypothetical protein
MSVIVPANTTATLVLPSAAGKKVSDKGLDIGKVKAIAQGGTSGRDVQLKVGSGTYELEYSWSPE